MDGRNSYGRRISLLNDDNPATSSFATSRHHSYSSQSSTASHSYSSSSLPRLHSFQSRTSSSTASTPCLSPPTPLLIRSSSSDSATDMQTPSPITPEFGYIDPMVAQQQQPVYADPTYFTKDAYAQYTSQPVAPLNPQYVQPAAQSAYYPPQSSAEPKQQPAQKSKKNQYPCPVAKQFNCTDYFTTSGHAARHAKKHTGKKDALCPDCNKAFTRKDNMEQHRRTHQNGRNAVKGSSSDEKVRKVQKLQQTRRPKPAPIQAAQSLVDPALPSLPISPTTSFTMTPNVQQMDAFNHEFLQQRSLYPDPLTCAINPGPRHDYTSPSYGLDTLALAAASGEKRKFDD